jgi:nitroimidazol reductase NimA-like FMN-containing flavoprotein (pyridoxamine 5'-phosphate oxidase superfamily)
MARVKTANDMANDTAPEPGRRTRIRRHPERAVPRRVGEILRAGRVAHVAFGVEGQPFILPFGYLYENETVYLHGAPASRTMKALRAGTPVCVEVTLLDGLIASRDAKSHSMNYRSAVVFGTAEVVSDLDEKRALFERMTAQYFPGRTVGTDYLAPRAGDLRAVDLLAVRIEERSAKVRTGPPLGAHDGDGFEGTATAYVVELPGLDS